MHATEPATVIDTDAALTDIPCQVSLPDGLFQLELEPVLGAWEPARPPPADALHWSVKAARTVARARWPGGELSGIGYVDWVHIEKPTRLLGLEELHWGRAHLPDRTVVFEHLTTVGGDRWDVGIEWRLDEAAPRTLVSPVRLGADGHGVIALSGQPLVLGVQSLRVALMPNEYDASKLELAYDSGTGAGGSTTARGSPSTAG